MAYKGKWKGKQLTDERFEFVAVVEKDEGFDYIFTRLRVKIKETTSF